MSRKAPSLKTKEQETLTLGIMPITKQDRIFLSNLSKPMTPITGLKSLGEPMAGIRTKRELSDTPPYLAGGTKQIHSTQITSTQSTSVRHFILPLSNNKKKFLQEEFITSQLFKEATRSSPRNPSFPKSKLLLNKASPFPLIPPQLQPPNPCYP